VRREPPSIPPQLRGELERPRGTAFRSAHDAAADRVPIKRSRRMAVFPSHGKLRAGAAVATAPSSRPVGATETAPLSDSRCADAREIRTLKPPVRRVTLDVLFRTVGVWPRQGSLGDHSERGLTCRRPWGRVDQRVVCAGRLPADARAMAVASCWGDLIVRRGRSWWLTILLVAAWPCARAGAADGAPSPSAPDSATAQGATAFVGLAYVDPPVDSPFAPDVTSVDGNEITFASAGVRVWLEVHFGGWAPFLLNTWQAGIDANDFSSGPGAPLTPAVQPCGSNSDCVTTMGPGCQCLDGFCHSGWQDVTRPDFEIQYGLSLVQDTTLAYRYGSTTHFLPPGNEPIEDQGITYYGGTLVIDVPVTAAGVYVFQLLTDKTTFLYEKYGNSLPLTYPTVRLSFPSACCSDGGTCSDFDVASCQSIGGTVVPPCMGDCDNNGRDDACDVAMGFAPDCNANLRPDSCDSRWESDADGMITLADFTRLAHCVGSPCPAGGCGAGAGFTDQCCALADTDGDGDVDLRDVAALHLTVQPAN